MTAWEVLALDRQEVRDLAPGQRLDDARRFVPRRRHRPILSAVFAAATGTRPTRGTQTPEPPTRTRSLTSRREAHYYRLCCAVGFLNSM